MQFSGFAFIKHPQNWNGTLKLNGHAIAPHLWENPFSLAQALANFVGRQSYHPNDFITIVLTGSNTNRRAGHLQKFCEEFNAGFIGTSFNRRCGQGKFQCIPDFTRNPILLRAWTHLYGERGALLQVSDGYH
jgi:hypothetical protein